MIREERDAGWWQGIADHPAVAPSIYLMGERFDFAPIVASPDVVPLATEHGGLLFHRHGDECELHAIFQPAGWGREANGAFKAGYEHMISLGVSEFRVSEVAGVKTSLPPLSHGWRPSGGFAPGPLSLRLRPWRLSLAAWRASPAFRRP